MKKSTILHRMYGDLDDYLKHHYPAFSQFIYDYFSFLEKPNNFLHMMSEFRDSLETNHSVEPFMEKVMVEMGWDFHSLTKNDSTIIANLMRDFYLTRGNISSINFLYTFLFNKTAKVTHPRDKLLKCSSSEFVNDFKVKFVPNNIVYFDPLKETCMLISVSEPKEIVINSVLYKIDDKGFFYELLVDGDAGFVAEDSAKITIGDEEIYGNLGTSCDIDSIVVSGKNYRPNDTLHNRKIVDGILKVDAISSGSIDNIIIKKGGHGYRVGDYITVDKLTIDDGAGFNAFVSKVTHYGRILKITIINSGKGYLKIPNLIVNSATGEDAIVVVDNKNIGGVKEATLSEPLWNRGFDTLHFTSDSGTECVIKFKNNMATFQTKKYFLNTNHLLGYNCILHDSLYYQEYSYEIESAVSAEVAERIVSDYYHPSGLYRHYLLRITESIELLGSAIPIECAHRVPYLGYHGEHSFLTHLETSRRVGLIGSFRLDELVIHSVKEYLHDPLIAPEIIAEPSKFTIDLYTASTLPSICFYGTQFNIETI
jgi:hypothetical protein